MKKAIVALVITLSLSARPAAAQNGEALFQQGLARQYAAGDVQGAVQIYEQVVKTSTSDRLIAEALVQLGACYEQLGQAKAVEYYQQDRKSVV